MNEERLVKIALQGGRYEGELTAPEETGIEAVHQGRVVAAARRDIPPSTAAITRWRKSLERGLDMQAGLLHQPAS